MITDYELGPRTYSVYEPEDLESNASVIFVFHGGGVGERDIVREQFQLEPIADLHKFYLVYPQGIGYSWNAGNCCGYSKSNQIDDVKFFRDIVSDIKSRYSIGKVYITGISNGAMMCYSLGIKSGDLINGICAISGGLGLPLDREFGNYRVPILHFHGGLDQNYPFNGGETLSGDTTVDFVSILDTLNYWIENNNSQKTYITISEEEVTIKTWIKKSFDSASVILYYLPNGGHTVPGGSDVTEGTGPLISSVNSPEIMWNFFSSNNTIKKLSDIGEPSLNKKYLTCLNNGDKIKVTWKLVKHAYVAAVSVCKNIKLFK